MDPQMRKLLEVSWEAWMDSGIDVNQLRGSSRVGVYIGCCGSEVLPPPPPLPSANSLKNFPLPLRLAQKLGPFHLRTHSDLFVADLRQPAPLSA